MRTLATLVVMLFAVACTDKWVDPANTPQQAFVPQYMTASAVSQVTVQTARATQQAGKIYAYGNYIFQNDLRLGIHIIDNTDRKHPVKLSFLKVPLSTEISIKGKYLYTNNYSDLLVFDLSDLQSPRLVKRVEKVFPVTDQQYPPYTNVVFECPDPAKGIVVSWELKNTSAARCRR